MIQEKKKLKGGTLILVHLLAHLNPDTNTLNLNATHRIRNISKRRETKRLGK